MYYKAEVFINNKLKFQKTYKDTNPIAVVRKVINKIDYPFMIILVMNEDGSVWEYTTYKRDISKTRIMKLKVPKYKISRILSGNMSILSR